MALIVEMVSAKDGIQAENVRTKVAKFAVCMEQVLKTKDAKYEGRLYSLGELIYHLKKEIVELSDAFDKLSDDPVANERAMEHVMHEAIDVANMCMYVHDGCNAMIRFNVDHQRKCG